MTCDVGAHTHLIGQMWPTPSPGLQIMSNGWSTMGFGLPAAIAAKLNFPEKHVCTVVGDGGFLMTAGGLPPPLPHNIKIALLLPTHKDLAPLPTTPPRKGN